MRQGLALLDSGYIDQLEVCRSLGTEVNSLHMGSKRFTKSSYHSKTPASHTANDVRVGNHSRVTVLETTF